VGGVTVRLSSASSARERGRQAATETTWKSVVFYLSEKEARKRTSADRLQTTKIIYLNRPGIAGDLLC